MQQISDITWRYNEHSQAYAPVLKLVELETHTIKTIELPGFSFSFELSQEKYCTGYYKDGKHHPCKAANPSTLLPQIIRDADFQCFTCEKIQGFKAAFLYKQEPNELAAQYLAQQHFIYLAYFEPGILKVGTAAGSRKMLRPIEQDALIHTYIAQSNGMSIQNFEHALAKQLNLKETVRTTHKFKYLHQKPDLEKAKTMLESTIQKIRSRFASSTEFAEWLLPAEEIKIIDLSTQSAIYYPQQEVFQVNEYDHLSGEFLGLRGRFLLFRNNDHIIAMDSKRLQGRLVTSSDSYDYRVGGDTIGLGI